MYIETIRKKVKSKTYTTFLIRRSYREKGKVKKETIANISKLPVEIISEITNLLAGKKGDFAVNDLENGNSYEYGASSAFLSLAKNIGLDKMIYSKQEEWRENVLAMIIGRITYQGSKLSLVNMYKDSALWELAGHKYGIRPDVDKHCYASMDRLLERKTKIERKLVKKHLDGGCIILYDLTNTWFEGEYKNSKIVLYGGKPKGGKKGYKMISIGLLTNTIGCPVCVEIFKGSTSDQTTVLNEIKKLSEQYGLKDIIFIGDRGLLTQKRIDEVNAEGFKTITALTHTQIKTLIKKENITAKQFIKNKIVEIRDLKDNKIRYVLCKDNGTMKEERETRNSLIKRVEEELRTKASVKRTRKKKRVAASIGRIFEKYKIEKFFDWDVNNRGKITWSLKTEVIEREKALDGCYIIRTEVAQEILEKGEVLDGYRSLQKVEQGFKNMKTILLELRPFYHKIDERIRAHVFITMLAYYLQWHAMERLKPLFDADGKNKDKRWNIQHVVERLKSIRKTDNLINGTVIKINITKPDAEQQRILELLGVKLE